MLICIDFDGTLVDEREYGDIASPFVLKRYARQALRALKAAGHILVLSSARSNRARRFNPELDPLFIPDLSPGADERTRAFCEFHQRRYQAMVDFVNTNLFGIFDYIDDGQQGKICADLFIDNRAIPYGDGVLTSFSWERIAAAYGDDPA